jgi:hypothetical protein
MSFYILTANCEIISGTTVARVTSLEKKIEENIKLIGEFDESVGPRLNDETTLIPGLEQPSDWQELLILGEQHDREYTEALDRVYNVNSIPEVDDIPTPDIDDCYLNTELASKTDPDGEARFGKVKKRLRIEDGQPIGRENSNPLLDSRMYEVEFYDDAKEAFAANIIAENLIAQVDEAGNRFVLMKEITGHQKGDDAMLEEDSWIATKSGTHRRKPTTRGWLIQVDWKDGCSSLLPLKDIKNHTL